MFPRLKCTQEGNYSLLFAYRATVEVPTHFVYPQGHRRGYFMFVFVFVCLSNLPQSQARRQLALKN